MSFISALPWSAWAVFAAIPLGIVLLYFLKLKRQPIEVPSTFLWKRTVEDLHVNSLIQRLRNNLLLFLQILFVGLVAIALWQPGIRSTAGAARRVVYLLDMSASMAAVIADDSGNKTTRFAEAKLRIAEQLRALRSDDEAMLIGFSDRADILQEFTYDKRRLLEALENAQVTTHATDLREALRAAAGLANPSRTSQAGDVKDVQVADAMPADLEIYSDGGFPAVTEFNLGNLNPKFHVIGKEVGSNAAILAFSAERALEEPEKIQVFARVASYGDIGISTRAVLTVDGELVDAQGVEIEPGGETSLTFELRRESVTGLQLSLEVEDALSQDNVAFAALSPRRQSSVLVLTTGNQALLLALQTEQLSSLARLDVRDPDYLKTEEYRKREEEGRDDLIIYDRCRPDKMPPVNTFFIGAIPPGMREIDGTASEDGREDSQEEQDSTVVKGWSEGETVSPIIPIDIDRTHPLMRYLELYSLRIIEGKAIQGPRGSRSLIEADAGAVMMLGPRDGYEDLVMGFELVTQLEDQGVAFNTDWPVQRSWPVFIFNVVRYLGGVVDTTSAVSMRPGESLAMRVDNRLASVEVETPEGARERIAVGPAGTLPYANTDQLGVYRVVSSNQKSPVGLFTVNLFDSRESDLTPVEEIELGYETVQGSVAASPRRTQWWRLLLLAAIGILAVEWVVFNRRIL